MSAQSGPGLGSARGGCGGGGVLPLPETAAGAAAAEAAAVDVAAAVQSWPVLQQQQKQLMPRAHGCGLGSDKQPASSLHLTA